MAIIKAIIVTALAELKDRNTGVFSLRLFIDRD